MSNWCTSCIGAWSTRAGNSARSHNATAAAAGEKMSQRLRVAVVGVGHVGKEHARILAGLPDVDLVGVADANHELAQTVAERLATKAFHEFQPLIHLVDAACIVTPTTT